MKKIPKILTIIFLTIFILQLASLIFLLILPNNTQAAEPLKFTPQIGIGEFQAGIGKAIGENSIGEYIREIYSYAIGIVGIIAAVVLMWGGLNWLTAGGDQGRITEAKAWIGASITGLIIALTSYLILFTVNPDLINFKPIKVATVDEMGCCQDASTCSLVLKSKCKKEWKGANMACKSDGKCSSTEEVCCLEYEAGQSEAMWCNIKKVGDCKKESAVNNGVNKVIPISNGSCTKFDKGLLGHYWECK